MESILIADDHPLTREALASLLEQHGFDVVGHASDGEEAIQEAGRLRPRLVLLDLTMPGMDGEAVFRELLGLRGNVPVLLMSGYNEQDALARFAGKGLAGFLQKPFTVEQLIEKLRHVLEGTP